MSDGTNRWDAVRAHRASMPAHVVSRPFSEETVLLNMQTGEYHGIDAIGARFLAVMLEQRDLSAARDILALEYDQPQEIIAEDLVSFLDEMLSRGLVEFQPAQG